MKTFKQFLLERLEDDIEKPEQISVPEKQSLPPSRKDYADTDEGAQQWKSDVKSWVPGAKKEAEQMTSNAESTYKTLGKVETGLKVADAVTDTALSAGAVAVPGVGTAINAAVKGVKAGINASQGNYGTAALNVADAALPVMGELQSAGKVAQTAGKFLKAPVESALEKGAEALGVTKSLAGETVKGIEGATSVLSDVGAQFGRNVAAKSGIKIAAKSASEPIKSTASDIVGSMASKTDDTSRSTISPTMSASASNFRGKTNIPKV
jgi:hypothetical protein